MRTNSLGNPGTVEIIESHHGIQLRGSLTIDTVNKLYRHPLALSGGEYTLDLSAVDKIDSAGLSLLVHWVQKASRENCQLVPLNIPGSILSMIRIQGLSDLFASSKSRNEVAD